MHIIYAAMRLYPFWAFPMAVVCGELAWYFRRKDSRWQFYFWAFSFIFGVTGLCWLIFRGDMNSDLWMNFVFRRDLL